MKNGVFDYANLAETPQTRYTLQRNTASIMKSLVLFNFEYR